MYKRQVFEACDCLKLLSIHFDLCVDATGVVCHQLGLLGTDLYAGLILCDKRREFRKKRFELEGSEKYKEVNNNIKRCMKKGKKMDRRTV